MTYNLWTEKKQHQNNQQKTHMPGIVFLPVVYDCNKHVSEVMASVATASSHKIHKGRVQTLEKASHSCLLGRISSTGHKLRLKNILYPNKPSHPSIERN